MKTASGARFVFQFTVPDPREHLKNKFARTYNFEIQPAESHDEALDVLEKELYSIVAEIKSQKNMRKLGRQNDTKNQSQ